MNLNRRALMKGVSFGAGNLLLAPLFARIRAEAAGIDSRPVRFVFVVEGNGLPPEHVHPQGIEFLNREQRDRFEEFPLDGCTLPTALEPVAKDQGRITIVQGLSGKICGGGHSNNFGALGAFPGKGGVGNSGQAIAETVDAALAKRLPGIFPVVGLGISDRPEHSTIYNCSAWGRDQKLPTQCRPDLAYATLFGSVAQGDGRQDFLAGQNLLDFMADDVRRMKARMGSADVEKLDSYLGAYETLRDRQRRLVEVRDTLGGVAPVPDDKYASAVETDRLDAHFDLAAAALIGGLTSVVTIASGVGDPFFSVRFKGLGIELDKHSIGHGGSFGTLTSTECYAKIRRFHFSQIAKLMDRLRAVREGDGTMLDNTLVVYLSDAAESHHSRCWEWPFVLIGDLGGRLRAGRYLRYPDYGRQGHRTMNSLYVTLLQAAGAKQDTFGQRDPLLDGIDQNGPLAELLA